MAHVRKKQYQAPITSYFSSGNGERLQSSRSPLSPPLDAATQASLLSVGMRVRKSVPEGYKTHKTLDMDGFPFPTPASSTAPPRTSYNPAPSRELTPFCGLHKIGGLSSQPPSSAPAIVGAGYATESFMSPTSSTIPPTKKRTFEEEIENDMDAFFDGVNQMDSAPRPRAIARPKTSLRRAASDHVRIAVDGEDFDEAPFLVMDVDAE
ncbi:hypothetical protein LTR27_001189 [Elasticomyces elasticus]|nr:hypothetical protein LTR27_001189 [Elasticomyces elasticus]